MQRRDATRNKNRGGGRQQKLLDFFSVSNLSAFLQIELCTTQETEKQTANGASGAYGQQRPWQTKASKRAECDWAGFLLKAGSAQSSWYDAALTKKDFMALDP